MENKTVNRCIGITALVSVLAIGWAVNNREAEQKAAQLAHERAYETGRLPLQKAQTYKEVPELNLLPKKLGLYQCDLSVFDRVGNRLVHKHTFEGDGWINHQQKYFTANWSWINETSGPLKGDHYSNGSQYLIYSNSRYEWLVEGEKKGKLSYTFEDKRMARVYYFSDCRYRK